MKTSRISTILILSALALVACSKDETYDFDGVTGTRVYVANTTNVSNTNVLSTPVGLVGGLKGDISLKSTSAVEGNVSGEITYDESYVEYYNNANATSYKTLPEGSVILEKTTLTIKDGAMNSDTTSLSLAASAVESMENGDSYLIPIVLKEVSGGNDTRLARDDKFKIRYFVLNFLKTNSLINDSASEVIGSATDKSVFKVTEATNLDPDGFSDLFSGGWYASWSFQEQTDNAAFTVDFGQTLSVSGFTITCYVATSSYVEISEDGSNWVELGSTSEHSAVYDQSTWTQVYVLYAGVNARYMRVKMTLNATHSYWQWGYGAIMGFEVYTE